MFKPLVGNQSAVPALPWMNNNTADGNPILDELQYDLAMNIFAFDPGHGLPYVETHVMEHGLYFLQGKGDYFLEDSRDESPRPTTSSGQVWLRPSTGFIRR